MTGSGVFNPNVAHPLNSVTQVRNVNASPWLCDNFFWVLIIFFTLKSIWKNSWLGQKDRSFISALARIQSEIHATENIGD
ncbi:MAG: hypothetical protein DME96_14610 [Verrucomicrobia bacterium]|nr:MAG: hypothetical protein DME96_14610 [Verrucomicrobiota bacterium]